MKSLSGKDLEIAKAISEWLLNLGYGKSLESFLEETSIKKEDIPKTKVLDKKWTTILTMQKKVNDLENKIKVMKDEYEQASVSGISYNTKTDSGSTMVSLLLIINIKTIGIAKSTRKAYNISTSSSNILPSTPSNL